MDRILDFLASTRAIVVAAMVLFGLTALSVTNFQSAAREVKYAGSMKEERQARAGFAATSDIQRVIILLTSALRHYGFRPDPKGELRAAADFLHVRAEAIRANRLEGPAEVHAETAVAAMFKIVELVDLALEKPRLNPSDLLDQTLPLAGAAQNALLLYLDEIRLSEDLLVARHEATFARQSALLWALLCALAGIGLAALMLLRREAQARHELEVAEGAARFLAYHDALTGLPNRTQFRAHASDLIARGQPSCLMFMDLDHFKGINDTYGHPVGDAVLKAMAKRLQDAAALDRAMVCRLSGDEFAVYLPTDDPAVIAAIGADILVRAQAPVRHHTEVVTPGLSIGMASTRQLPPQEQPGFSALARFADFALYEAKADGRGRLREFDLEMARRYTERRLLVAELPGAISDNHLKVFLQPKVDLATGRTLGFEALVRWLRAGEMVSPDQFIQLAEESGVVVDVDRFVLHEATRLVSEWNLAHGSALGVSVNVSAANFATAAIVMEVKRALRASGLPAGLLTLEITETLQLRNWEQVSAVIEDIRRLGCRIAIDDFGTGYSSLAYLQAIRADELKIDRSLVNTLATCGDAWHVLRSVVALADSLNLVTVAEGIETEAQRQILRDLGCEAGQGYLFSAPQEARAALQAASSAWVLPASAVS